jgi:hypothetical protein
VSGGTDRDVGQFEQWAPEYDRDRLQRRFFGPVHDRTGPVTLKWLHLLL